MYDLASLCGLTSRLVSFNLSGMIRTQHNMDEGTGSAGSPAFSPPNPPAKQALRQVAGDKEMGG